MAVLGGGRGIGQIGGQACEGIARQPEAGGRIGTNMLIAAALVEGVTFAAIIFSLSAFQVSLVCAGGQRRRMPLLKGCSAHDELSARYLVKPGLADFDLATAVWILILFIVGGNDPLQDRLEKCARRSQGARAAHPHRHRRGRSRPRQG